MTLEELLGVELPVIQAPMAGVQGSALAVAVSEAGGLGSVPCGMLGADAVRRELAAVRAGTDRPIAANFFCHATPRPDAGERGGRRRGGRRCGRTTRSWASSPRPPLTPPTPPGTRRRAGRRGGRSTRRRRTCWRSSSRRW